MGKRGIKRSEEELKKIKLKISEKEDQIRDIFLNEDLANEYDHLIERVAFLSVHSKELEKEINEKGWVEEYQHGKDQWGTKESIASSVYFKTIKSLNTLTKQLREILVNEDQDPNGNGNDICEVGINLDSIISG